MSKRFNISVDEKTRFGDEFYITYNDNPLPVFLKISKTELAVPFCFGKRKSKPLAFNTTTFFTGKLKPEQEVVKKEILAFFEKTRCAILACYTGFGKTILSINIASCLGQKVLVVTNRIVLLNQWVESIAQFTASTTTVLSKKLSVIENGFYIVNVTQISKVPQILLKQFNFVIIDELHQILSKTNFVQLLHLAPTYLLGLSATPYRNDDLNVLFAKFFGKNVVTNPLQKRHNVFITRTSFSPVLEYNAQQRVNWNKVLEDQAADEDRNELILQILKKKYYSSSTTLLLVKRIAHGELLFKKLKQRGMDNVVTLFGKNQTFDRNCKILIGTNLKIGTGFDFVKLDTLVIAADLVQYYIQFLGRVMRSTFVPEVYDFDDQNGILKNHLKKRIEVYNKHGGVVKRITKTDLLNFA